MSKGKKSASSDRRRLLLSSQVGDVRAEWRDPLPAGKTVSAVRRKMRVPVDGPLVNFESSIEKDFLTLCRADRRIGEVHAQRLVLHFTDLRTGKRRRYTPDFVVVPEESVGMSWKRAVVEVKTWRDLLRSRQSRGPGYAAARLWCLDEEGTIFRVVTDRQMSGPWMTNARMISAYVDAPVSLDALELCRELVKSRVEWRVEEIVSAARERGFNPHSIMPVIHRMLAHGELWFDRGHVLDMRTWVTVGTPWRL